MVTRNTKKVKPSNKGKDTRTRNWTCVLYEDSMPQNYVDILDEEHIEWIESPWHDKDVNADGQPKKKHKHVLLMFGGVKSYEQVKEITDKLGAPIPQRVHNAKAMVRYMAHLDNPDKAQYNPEDIKAHGGVDLAELMRPNSSERYTLIKEMMTFIKDNGITEMQDLLDFALEARFDDWFPLLCDSCAYIIGTYIKSQRHRAQTPEEVASDED